MKYTDVKSSNVAQVGYDSLTGTMGVKFNNGTVYEYDDVPVEIFEGVRDAESVGRVFNSTVKNAFQFRKVEG